MLRLAADVRVEERRGAGGAFLTLFGILAGHTMLETARDALFLARLPASQLPWMYMAMAAVAVPLAQAPWRRARRLSGVASLALLLVTCGAVTLGFWALGSWTSGWTLRALYVWTGLVGTLAALQFWLVLGEAYNITQAKRLFRIVALGSLLGAVAGATLARAVSVHFTPDSLVLGAAVLFVLTGAFPVLLLPRPESAPAPERGRASLLRSLERLRREPYLVRLAGLVLVSTVAVTLADYVFKSAVVRAVPAAELGSFFATFYLVLNALALLTQLFLMGWLLREFGVHRALWVLPALLFVGAAGVAFGGGLVAALLLKGADGALRNSVHRTSTELLFVPVPDALRARAKPLIDVVGQRGGQALASVFILGEVSLQRGDAVLAGASAVLCAVWIAWTAELRGHYLELFRAALREGSLRDQADLPELDLGSLEALIAALNSSNDAEVTAALDLLAAENRTRLIPALILYHPSPRVVLRALDLFEKDARRDFLPLAERLLAHPDPEVRAAALRAHAAVRADQAVLRKAARDESPLVRASAMVGLVADGWISDEAQATLDELLAGGSPEAHVALARAIARRPAPAFEEVLLQLARSPRPEVLREAAVAMGALKGERFLDPLVGMLDVREVRAAAREALLTHGAPALAALERALADPSLPHEIRRHLPRTISLFPPAEAARVLVSRLLPEQDGMVRFKILRGLGRLASSHPDLPLDRAVLEEATRRTVEAALRLVHWREVLVRGASEDPRRKTAGHELLATLLRDKEVHAVERVFRLLGLQERGEDWKRMHRGLGNTNPRVRASSRELLEHLVRPPLRGAVLALVDDGSGGDRLAQAEAYWRPQPLGYEELLGLLLEQPSETVRCIAAYHVGELGLSALRSRLESHAPQEGFFAARVMERALGMLEPGAAGGLAGAR